MVYLAVLISLLVAVVQIAKSAGRTKREQAIFTLGRELRRLVGQHFLTMPCTTCHEFEMELLSVSPNSRSIHYACRHCGKKAHAAAMTPEASQTLERHQQLGILLTDFNSKYPGTPFITAFVFETPKAPLPFEQTVREPIPEAVRTEVWRRDAGRCVTCGSNQNLEFDHIIPVSKGGATSARNLQLLCKPCNLTKAAHI
ncbi:MAG: HNH endonuclease [Deltaproteobacteria bacterium]|nr:HNH endonuclease [Deltaproteobacteria bacterium]